jgi:hypothetical protein
MPTLAGKFYFRRLHSLTELPQTLGANMGINHHSVSFVILVIHEHWSSKQFTTVFMGL